MKLIHYGAKAFNPSYFLPIKNTVWQKPEGGWGSYCHIDEAKVMELGVVEMAKNMA